MQAKTLTNINFSGVILMPDQMILLLTPKLSGPHHFIERQEIVKILKWLGQYLSV